MSLSYVFGSKTCLLEEGTTQKRTKELPRRFFLHGSQGTVHGTLGALFFRSHRQLFCTPVTRGTASYLIRGRCNCISRGISLPMNLVENPLAAQRVRDAQRILDRVPDSLLRNCHVEDTIADGMCFFHAISQELEYSDSTKVWYLASAVLLDMASRIEAWQQFCPDDFQDEREANLRRCGLLASLQRRHFSTIAYNAHLYLLDRLCGVNDKDWGYERLYTDDVVILQT